jgi:hypothetical protein
MSASPPPDTSGATSWSWAGGLALGVLTGVLVWLGIYPAPLVMAIRVAVANFL